MALPSYDELVSQKLPSYEDLTALPSYDELTKASDSKPDPAKYGEIRATPSVLDDLKAGRYSDAALNSARTIGGWADAALAPGQPSPPSAPDNPFVAAAKSTMPGLQMLNPEMVGQLPFFMVPGAAEAYAVGQLAHLPEQYGHLKEKIQKEGLTAENANEVLNTVTQDALAALPVAARMELNAKAKAGEVPKPSEASSLPTSDQRPVATFETSTPSEPLPPVAASREIPISPARQNVSEIPQPEITIPVDERQGPSAPSDNTAMARFQGDVSAAPNPEAQPASDATGPMAVSPKFRILEGLLPGDGQGLHSDAEYASGSSLLKEAVNEYRKIVGDDARISLAEQQAIAAELDNGKSIPVAALEVHNEYEAHRKARQSVNEAINAEKIESGQQAQALYEQVYNQSKRETPSVPSATEANSALGKPNETVSSTERPIGDSAPTGETLGGSNEPPSSAPGAATGAEPVRATVDETPSDVTGSPETAGTSNRAFGETYGEDVIPGGTGADTSQLLDNARSAIRTGEVDPYSVLSATRRSGIANPVEYAALAAEHERLVNDAVAKQKTGDPSAPEAAKRAEDFANAIQPHKTAASDLMRLFQGDLNYDLSTPFGMEQYMKAELGRAMKPSEKPVFARRSLEIRQGENGVKRAIERSDGRVSRRYSKVRDIPMEEAASRVKEWMKDCQV